MYKQVRKRVMEATGKCTRLKQIKSAEEWSETKEIFVNQARS